MKIHLPTHPSQVKLRTYVAFKVAADDVERVRVITGLSRKEIAGLKPATIEEVINQFTLAAESSTGVFQRHLKVRKGIRRMKLSFIPNLSTCTLGEWVDMDDTDKAIYARDGKSKPRFDLLPLLIAKMYRPLTEQMFGDYKIQAYDPDKKAHLQFVEEMSMDVVNSAQLFFSTSVARLLKSSQEYLAQEMKKQTQILELSLH